MRKKEIKVKVIIDYDVHRCGLPFAMLMVEDAIKRGKKVTIELDEVNDDN